ncbi:hypothetical protein [Priestia megaterium]|uniref:hypothetical protein n=1 Tax=Priestia megaterium TaxID=1404 RepID=UPI000BF49B52|nr:hypothetical protein [Priestia megaterium]PFR90686.1 hypothetical protein COK39_24640 [Priestia megaterium]
MAKDVSIKVGLWCKNRHDENNPGVKSCSCEDLEVNYGVSEDSNDPLDVCDIVTVEMTDEDYVSMMDVRYALNMSPEEFSEHYRGTFFPENGYQAPPSERKKR